MLPMYHFMSLTTQVISSFVLSTGDIFKVLFHGDDVVIPRGLTVDLRFTSLFPVNGYLCIWPGLNMITMG